MKIRTLSIPITQDDYDKIYRAADIFERQQARPRSKISVREFILEVALDRAEAILAKTVRTSPAGGSNV